MGTLYIRRDSLAVNLKPWRSPRTLSWADDKFSWLRFFSLLSPQNYALFSFFNLLFSMFLSCLSCSFYLHGYCSSTPLIVIIVPITFNTIQFAIIVHRCVSKSMLFYRPSHLLSVSKVAKRASKYAPRGRRPKKKEVSSSLGLSRSRSGSWSWEEGKVTELDR